MVFGYNRPDKIENCLNSILQNKEEISQTELYIFLDGSKTEKDDQQVEKVQEYVNHWHGKDAFLGWHVTCRENNIGLANNVISGVTEVIKKHNRAIVVEDDLIVSPKFLWYMNAALEYYEQFSNIWSIGGYAPNLKALRKYKPEVWFGYRATSWGWATWKDRWETTDWNMTDYQEFLKDEERKKNFLRGGEDMLAMLQRQMDGYLDSWAIRWCYAQSKQDKLTVFPTKSYVLNDGHDGSGVHSGYKNIKAAEVLNLQEIKFGLPELNKSICKEYRMILADTLTRKIKRNLGKRGVRKLLKLDKSPRVAILYICTGEYVVFWKKFYRSMKRHFLPGAETHFYVFTDAKTIFNEQDEKVHRIYQKQLGWPYDTLKRFDMFLSIQEQLQEFDYLFFFNSNIVLKRTIKKEDILPTPKEKLVFTLHPGQYSNSCNEFTYERNPESRAYIPVGEGEVYVAGGLNGGITENFLAMCKELKNRIDEDEKKGIIAIYHDESQINRYAYELETFKLLHPGYLYPEDWKVPYPKVGLLLAKSKYIHVKQIKKW